VVVVQSANLGNPNHRLEVGILDGSRLRGILLRQQVPPELMIIAKVARQRSPQVGFSQHDHVVEAVDYYNTVRLHSAIGYVTPKDKLEGREQIIFAERDPKLREAREQRKARRQAAKRSTAANPPAAVIACQPA
jgi:hypothetical protein